MLRFRIIYLSLLMNQENKESVKYINSFLSENIVTDIYCHIIITSLSQISYISVIIKSFN